MFGCSASIAMELFIGPVRHQPLDRDGTVPSNHLLNFEHSLISISLFTYAALAVLFDKLSGSMKCESRSKELFNLTQLLGAFAFTLEFLLFHFHSSDHMGLEGQYHLVFQTVITVSIVTTLIGIPRPKDFLISFVRSVSILFQGFWLIIMGIMLWTPKLISKGCWMNFEDGHYVVRCGSDHALHRAKSMANTLFSISVIGATVFSVVLFISLPMIYKERVECLRALGVDIDDMNPKNKSSKSRDNDYDIAVFATSYSL